MELSSIAAFLYGNKYLLTGVLFIILYIPILNIFFDENKKMPNIIWLFLSVIMIIFSCVWFFKFLMKVGQYAG